MLQVTACTHSTAPDKHAWDLNNRLLILPTVVALYRLGVKVLTLTSAEMWHVSSTWLTL
jgi:hypothetical protein